MAFSDELGGYLETYNISAADLAAASGISASTISRFRTGKREPSPEGNHVARLAAALAVLAVSKEGESPAEDEIAAKLMASLSRQPVDYDRLARNLGLIMSELEVNAHDLSRFLNFDASYLSRIRSGQRKPANAAEFCHGVADFIAMRYGRRNANALVRLIGCERAVLEDPDTCHQVIFEWLLKGKAESTSSSQAVASFFEKLDSFDMQTFMHAVGSSDVASSLPQPPDIQGIAEYRTLKGFIQAQLDWLRLTVLSQPAEPIIFYSDMPMEDMAKDSDFAREWLGGLGLLLSHGFRLQVIHDVNRSFYEMMLGLEGWIPLYMSGLISPYYFKEVNDSVFCHYVAVSDAAALTGEAVRGSFEDGRMRLGVSEEERAYGRERARSMLAQAQPLMVIYRQDKAQAYADFLQEVQDQGEGPWRSRLNTLPLYTLSDEVLESVLAHNDLTPEEESRVRHLVGQARQMADQLLATTAIFDEIPQVSQEEFREHPLSLSLSDGFFPRQICYTYEEYEQHKDSTRLYAQVHERYDYALVEHQRFRNIQIRSIANSWVIVSKDMAPAIHFVICHPRLRQAIQDMLLPFA